MRESLHQSIDNLRTNKLRSCLTMFGIMWGVISIVILSALGEGFQRGNQAVLEELGKNIGDDLAEGKPTLPLIHALRHGDAASIAMIRSAIEQGGTEEQGPILAVVESTGGLDYTAQLADEEARRAEDALADVPASAYRDALAALARFAINRSA